jgi:hypothetical protein
MVPPNLKSRCQTPEVISSTIEVADIFIFTAVNVCLDGSKIKNVPMKKKKE